MRIRSWVESVNLSVTKRQFSHQLVYKMMDAFNRVHRAHSWSWAQRDFVFTSQAKLLSTKVWTGTAGDEFVTTSGGDITRAYTGAEVQIKGAEGTFYARIERVGDRNDQTYAIDNVYLDQPVPITFTAGVITVFRREYVPRVPKLDLVSGGLTGDLRNRNYGNRDNLLIKLTKTEFDREYGTGPDFVGASDQVMRHYTIAEPLNIPAPRFAPTVTATGTALTKVGVAGVYYMAFAYVDKASGQRGPIGPILTYTNAATAAGAHIEVEYNNTDGTPEESYELTLLVSPVDPVGFDNTAPEDKDFRISETMIPFFVVGTHPADTTTNGAGTKGGGKLADFGLDEDVTSLRRWWVTGEQISIRFREIPTAAEVYSISGKVLHPWMNYIDDEPFIPEGMKDAVLHAVRASIQGQEGLLSDRRFGFVISKLIRKDRLKSTISSPRHGRRGESGIVYDRYDLNG